MSFRRIRTTGQARKARARAITSLDLRRAVRDGDLDAYECTRTLPSGTIWTRRWEATR